MASIIGIPRRLGRARSHCWQTQGSVRRRGPGARTALQAGPARYVRCDAEDDGQCQHHIPRQPGPGDPGHPARRQSYCGRDAHGWRQEYVFHVTRICGWRVDGAVCRTTMFEQGGNYKANKSLSNPSFRDWMFGLYCWRGSKVPGSHL